MATPKHKYRKQKGMALVMAIILVPVLMMIAVSFIDPVIRSYRAAANDQKTVLVKSVADSMFEEALWQTRETGTGETTQGCICDDGIDCYPTKCAAGKDYGFGTAHGDWWVFGTPETDTEHLINNYYTVPSPGSGDAGGDYCSTKDPVVEWDDAGGITGLRNKQMELLPDILDENFFPLQTGDILEWSCHWNRLQEGESVSIPLYVEESGVVKNPVDLGLNQFTLNVRAACNPTLSGAEPGPGGFTRSDPYIDEICAPGERYSLEFSDPYEVTVLWEITGEQLDTNGDPTGESFYLGPLVESIWLNSNIRPADINGYNTANVLTDNLKIVDQDNTKKPIEFFITNDPLSAYHLNRPVLTFRVIHTLRDVNNAQVPYIEYQFSAPAPTGGNPPISNTSKVVRVDVMVDGGYSETIEKNIALPKGSTGFVIQN